MININDTEDYGTNILANQNTYHLVDVFLSKSSFSRHVRVLCILGAGLSIKQTKKASRGRKKQKIVY